MYDFCKEWGNVILRAAVIIVILFFFLWPLRLEGSSMESTLNDGDMVCMSRALAELGQYETGDVVVFRYYDKGVEKTVLKRIIATAGETIRITAEGTVEVNGEALQEDYVTGETCGLVDMTVPKDTVFVMGDNREVSFDSRQMGVISEKDIQGKVLFRWYPFGAIEGF